MSSTALKSRLSRSERTLVRAALGDRLYALVWVKSTAVDGVLVENAEPRNLDDSTDVSGRLLARAIADGLVELGPVVTLTNAPQRRFREWRQVSATAKGRDRLVVIGRGAAPQEA